MRSVKVFVILFTMVFASGCAHQLQVKNLASYTATTPTMLKERQSIGVIASVGDEHSKALVKGLVDELKRNSADVIYPYSSHPNWDVDYIASVSVKPTYKGSGYNFLVNFPGFLVFAPAWNGYIYKVDYDVNIELKDAKTGAVVSTMNQPINLDVRHAAINRTWTQLSYLEVGAIALVSGIMFTNYDNSVSPLVAQRVERPLGEYFAQMVISEINNTADHDIAIR